MTATNHAVTGALIGIAIANPLAIPLAFISHFALDMLPHFGLAKRNNIFKIYLVIDAILVLILMGIFIMYGVPNIWIVLTAMIAATSPDIAWAYRWYKEEKHGANPKEFHDPLTKFHSQIQWYEKPQGIIVELLWFCGISLIISSIL